MNSEIPHPYLDKLLRKPNVKERKDFVVHIKQQSIPRDDVDVSTRVHVPISKTEDTFEHESTKKEVDKHKPHKENKAHEPKHRIAFFDDRDETNVNRDLILSKLITQMGISEEKKEKMDENLEEYTPSLFMDEDTEQQKQMHEDVEEIKDETEHATKVRPNAHAKLHETATTKYEVMDDVEIKTETSIPKNALVGIRKRQPRKSAEQRKIESEYNVLAKSRIHKNATGINLLSRMPKPEKIVMRVSNYYMENRKMYAQKLAEMFIDYNKELLKEESNISCDSSLRNEKEQLMIHQRVARDYLNLFTPYRGLLLYYGLGAGKTLASIAIAEGMKSEKKIILMTPASLKSNYMTELKKYGEQLYRKNQYWEFISIEGKPEYVDMLSKALSLPVDFIKKHKGAFLVNVNKKEVNFQDLDANQQQLLDLQLEQMIRAKYLDINYNGLSGRIFNELTKENTINPFDNSVVVIDEAHNFVSWIVNKLKEPKEKASRMYDMLMGAENARIVLLSGTPIINYPNEIAVLFNLLRGYIKTWEFHITSSGVLNKEKLLKMFDDEKLDVYDYVDYTNNKLTITRNPFGFVNTKENVNKKKEVNVGVELEYEIPTLEVVDKTPTVVDELEKETKESSVQEKFQTIVDETPVKSATKESKDTTEPSVSKKPSTETPTIRRRTIKKKTMDGGEHDSDDTDDDTTDDESYDGGAKNGKKKPKETKKGTKKEKLDLEKNVYKVVDGMVIETAPIPQTTDENDQKEMDKQMLQYVNNMGESALEMKGGEVFVSSDYKGVFFKDEQGNVSDQLFLAKLKEILTKNKITFAPKVHVHKYKCLPDNPDEFNSLFVDMDSQIMRNVNLFKKRILGLTSYFRSAQEGLLPSFIKDVDDSNYHLEFVEMSDHQFKQYSIFRSAEIKEQDRKMLQQKKKGEDDKYSASYRIYSRLSCNFTFPDGIKRPMPDSGVELNEDAESEKLEKNAMKMGKMDIEEPEDTIKDEDEKVDEDEKEGYNTKIKKALEKLKDGDGIDPHPLSNEGLAIHSPKFLRIFENISDEENKGLHLLYSDFLSLEGVNIFKLVLEHNGYSEFKIKKVGNDWDIDGWEDETERAKPKFILYTGESNAIEKEILRNIYNSDWKFVPSTIVNKLESISKNNYYGEIARVLIITSAGAEGINLKNTRFVHIMESYWNMVRIDQVVGRARRICSHNDLPKEMQNVKVFFYLSTFSKKQIDGKENKDVMIRDINKKGHPITTDEHLYMKAMEKQELNEQLLKAVKETAIDCNLYSKTRDAEKLVCFGYGKVATNDFSSYPRIDDDMKVKEELNVKEAKIKLDKVIMKKGGIEYVFAKDDEGKLYDMDVYQNSGQLVYVGKLEKVDGKNRFVPK